MSYARTYRKPSKNTAETNKLVGRIEKVAARGVKTLTDWERGFLESLLTSAKKWGRLTERQSDTFKRIEYNTNPEVVNARNNWVNNWNEDKRSKAVFAAEYYKQNPPYFSGPATRILTDPDYIPTEKLYRKMVENKYVTRAMSNTAAKPLYMPGHFATVRNNYSTQTMRDLAALRDKQVLVISVDEKTLSAAKGSKKYTILPIGATDTIVVEERHLKKAKKS